MPWSHVRLVAATLSRGAFLLSALLATMALADGLHLTPKEEGLLRAMMLEEVDVGPRVATRLFVQVSAQALPWTQWP
jgi:hypothetical protein